MAGIINWGGTNSGPTNDSQLSGSRINWGSTLKAQRQTNAVIEAQNRRVQQSRQQEQQLLQQQQSQPKPSFISRTLGFAKSAAVDTGHAARAVARPVIDVASGQGGKATHDTAQLSNDVSGGTVNQFAKAVRFTPQAVGREVRGKPITDIQQKAFGTTKPADIAKKIVGSTVGTGSLFVGGGATKTAVTKGAKAIDLAVQGAKAGAAGAAGGAGATVTQNPNATGKEIARNASVAGVAGFVAPAAGKAVGKAVRETVGVKQTFVNGPKALLDNVKANRLLQAGEEANKPVKIPVGGESTAEPITVKAPLHPVINEVHTADKVTVRTPQPMSDQEFTKQFNGLSKDYEKDTKFLQQSAPNLAPKEVQALSDGLEVKHQGKLNDLIDNYNNPQLSPAVEPKPLKVAQDKVPTPAPARQPTLDTTKPLPPETAPGLAAPSTDVVPAETVKVPKDQLPVGTGTERTSRLEARMQTSMQNLTDEQKAGLSTYKQMNKQENISAAAMYVDKHPEEAMQVLRGEKAPPNGIAHNSVFLAMDAKGADDPELARKLASLRSTRAGQEISLLTEANPHSPTTNISNLRNIRIEAKGGEAKVRAHNTAVEKAIRASTPKVTKDSWDQFITSLRC